MEMKRGKEETKGERRLIIIHSYMLLVASYPGHCQLTILHYILISPLTNDIESDILLHGKVQDTYINLTHIVSLMK